MTIKTVTLREGLRTFITISIQVLLRMITKILDKIAEKIKIHSLRYISLPLPPSPPENRAIQKKMRKDTVDPDWPQMII